MDLQPGSEQRAFAERIRGFLEQVISTRINAVRAEVVELMFLHLLIFVLERWIFLRFEQRLLLTEDQRATVWGQSQ
jgi:hypothetical protein